MRKPIDDTVIQRGARTFSYGPRVERGENVEPPRLGQLPAFFGVYESKPTEIGFHWEWIGDARDEASAKRFIAAIAP